MLFKRARPDLNDNSPVPALENPSMSVIGADTDVEGNLNSDGEVRIEGRLRGEVRARRCIVEADGTVEGQVIADEIVVRGRVEGPLKGYLVHLENGAQVRGDVVNERIVIDSGAELTGSVWRSDDPLSEEQRPARPATRRSEAEKFAAESLWAEANGGDFRPLMAIRPR